METVKETRESVQQMLGAAGKARKLGLRLHFKRKKDPGIGHMV